MFPLNHIGTKLINENHKIPEKTILVNSFEQKLDQRSLNSPCIHCIISEILKKNTFGRQIWILDLNKIASNRNAYSNGLYMGISEYLLFA